MSQTTWLVLDQGLLRSALMVRPPIKRPGLRVAQSSSILSHEGSGIQSSSVNARICPRAC